MLLITSKLRIKSEIMPALGAELMIPLYANSCALVHTFKNLHAWCSFSLRCDDAVLEPQHSWCYTVTQIRFAVFCAVATAELDYIPHANTSCCLGWTQKIKQMLEAEVLKWIGALTVIFKFTECAAVNISSPPHLRGRGFLVLPLHNLSTP